MGYKFPRPRKGRPYVPRTRPTFAKSAEQLYGSVNGMSATEGEERFYRAITKNTNVQGTLFRMSVGAPKGMPGWKELDFLVQTYTGYKAIQIDGADYVHRGTTEEDKMRDLITINYLAQYGVNEVVHVRADQLETQEGANEIARRIL